MILGDCFEVMKEWPDAHVDAIITSPPFRDEDITGEYYEWYSKFVSECQRVSRDYAIIFNSARREKEIYRKTDPFEKITWIKAPSAYKYKTNPLFVYAGIKPSFNFLGPMWANVLWSREQGGIGFVVEPVLRSEHPYEDPMDIYVYCLRMLQTGGSNLIYDPFSGTGTALAACMKLGLKGIGTEIEPSYYALAIKRLKELEGQRHLFD